MNKLIHLIIIALSLLSGALAQGQVQGQTNNVNVFVVVTPTTYQLDLKAIEGETPTTNFVIKPQSVVQVKQGDNLVVVTQPINQIVDSVKVQDQTGVFKELTPSGNNAYSLTGIPVGAYILDVIVDLGDNNRGAYETILVILAQDQKPVSPQQIIQTIKISDTIIFEDDRRDRDRDPCKRFEDREKVCKPIPDNGQCEQGYVKLFGACYDSDAILDHDTEEECQADPLCREYRDRYPSEPVEPTPPCETVEPGTLCEDEGEASTPICDEGEILSVDNRCVTQKIPVTPIYPDEPEEGDQDTGEDNNNGNGDNGNDDSGDSGNGDDSSESQPDQDPPGEFFE